MSHLEAWFNRQAEQQIGSVSLQDALLGNQFRAYAWLRLRYFTLRLGTAAALHALKVAVLYQVFSHSEFITVILIQTALGLVGSFWWGLLELMRGQVRDLYRSERQHRISREIGAWLSLSIQISLLTVVIGLAWGLWRVWVGGLEFGAAELYLVAVLFGFALSVPSRCYHSGIYAIRRIYRPPLAILTVEAVSFVGILALWPWLGPWSLPVGAIVSNLAATGILVRYTRRSFGFSRLAPSKFMRLKRLRPPPEVFTTTALKSGLAYVVMNMDSLLVLALLTARSSSSGNPELFIIFFLLGPTIRAGSDWAQLFLLRLETA